MGKHRGRTGKLACDEQTSTDRLNVYQRKSKFEAKVKERTVLQLTSDFWEAKE